jgi:hypothetical protein
MALGPLELAQIVWAETRALGTAPADGSGDVNGVRRLVAELAASVAGKGFDKRASVLPTGDTAKALGLIADAAKDTPLPVSRLIFWETDSNSSNLSSASREPPPPWDAISPDEAKFVNSFVLPGGRVISVFSRPPRAGDADGAVFVNALTGTGVQGGNPILAERWAVAPRPQLGFSLFLAAVMCFVLAAAWAYGVGVASRQTVQAFESFALEGDNCKIDPTTDAKFFVGPEKWRLDEKGGNACREKYLEALKKISEKDTSEGTLYDRFVVQSLNLADSSGSSASLVYPLALMFFALALLFVSAGYGIVGRPMGAIIDERNRMSLTTTQLVVWSVIVLGGWLVFALYNVGFGAGKLSAVAQASFMTKKKLDVVLFPDIPTILFAVLGIAAAAPIVSDLIAKTDLLVKNEKGAGTPTPVGDGTRAKVPQYLARNPDPSRAKLGDMVKREVDGSEESVDASRVQHAAITGILVVAYAILLFDAASAVEPTSIWYAANNPVAVFPSLPALGGTFLTLLFASHAALAVGKATDKRSAEPRNPKTAQNDAIGSFRQR